MRRALRLERAAFFVLVALASAVPTAAAPRHPAGDGEVHAGGKVAYPLKLSANRRYLVDQRNRPFMIVGDSPQALIGNVSVKDASAYIKNRKAAGFNALWINLLCTKYTACRDDGTTFDGIKPFTTPGDLSSPNPAYFARAGLMLGLAKRAGLVIFLDPIETGGWLGTLRRNGPAKAREYGRFLGRRFKQFPNIVWMSGNDFQSWQSADDDNLVHAVAEGIHATDPSHLQTIELDYPTSGSRDDPRWLDVIGLDAAYTYYPTYAQVLREYNRTPSLPVFMVEAGYEFEQNGSSISPGDPPILRRQEYWSLLSGATGQFYGNHYTWQFESDWKKHLDTTGSRQMRYLIRLFSGRRWFQLVPDQAHRVVTAGFGRFTTQGNVGSSNYVTTAMTQDGTLAVSYLPTGGTITVDAARFGGRVRARWYDPTNGTLSKVAHSPFGNSGRIRVTAPARNHAGDHDWVLLLTAH